MSAVFKPLQLSIPRVKEYCVKKTSSINVQAPRFNPLYLEKPVSDKTVLRLMKELKDNVANFDVLRGRIAGQAEQAGLKLNIRFPMTGSKKMAVDIVDADAITKHELQATACDMFSINPKKAWANFKKLMTAPAEPYYRSQADYVRTVEFNPNEDYAAKISGALLDVIEGKALAGRL